MSIRYKVFAVLVIILVILALLMQLFSSLVITSNYRNIEHDETTEHLTQLQQVLDVDSDDLATLIEDYSNWNDTYAFSHNYDQAYIDSNFVDTTFISQNLDVVVISGLNGTIEFAKTLDVQTMQEIPTDDGLLDMLRTGGKLLNVTEANNDWNGYTVTSGHLGWTACRKIYTSEGEGTPVGMMTYVRWIDPDMIKKIQHQTTYAVNVTTFNGAQLETKLGHGQYNELITNGQIAVVENESNMTLYLLKNDVNGNPILVLTTPYERDINLHLISTLNTYMSYFLVTCLAILIIFMILLEKVVISKVIKFDRDVDDISKRKGSSRRIQVSGGDEISTLAASVNDMLRNIEDAQRSVVESERRYRAIVQDQTELIFRSNKKGELTFANDSFLEYYGMDIAGLTGRTTASLLVPEDEEKLVKTLTELQRAQGSLCIQLRCRDGAGESRWQQWTISMIPDVDDASRCDYQVVASDITAQLLADIELRNYRDRLEEMVKERTHELMSVNEILQKEVQRRRQVEEDLQESQSQYKAVVEDQTELIYRISPNGRIRFANNAFLKYYGLDLSKDKDRSYMANILDDDRPGYVTFINSLDRDHPVGMIGYRVLLRAEEVRWQQWTYRLIFDANGSLAEIQGVGRDITDQKLLEDEMLRSERLESLGSLAGGMAHEFNNTLTKVLGNVSLAKNMVKPSDPLHQRLEATERAIYDAKRLTDSILTFSDGGEPMKQVVTLEEIVRDAGSTATAGSNVGLTMDIAADLWTVDADQAQIQQALRVVLSNAVESMPGGGIVKVIASNILVDDGSETMDLPNGRYVRVEVIDHGEGIPRDRLPRIFEPYYSTKGRGGLGLATAMSIMRKHGGTIMVESAVHVGSKFTIVLPATDKARTENNIAAPLAASQHARILLMDDEEGILEVGSELLKEFGYQVDCARTGEEAIKMYSSALKEGRRYGLIIMDLTIKGGMGGKEAIRKILELDPNARAIVSSGYSHDPVMAHPQDYGFRGVVKKPYMIGEMLQEIRRILSEQPSR